MDAATNTQFLLNRHQSLDDNARELLERIGAVEAGPAPVQSRDVTALAGHYNALDNLRGSCPGTAGDLDFPVRRATWLDQNEKEMLRQRDMVGTAVAHFCDNGYEAHNKHGRRPRESCPSRSAWQRAYPRRTAQAQADHLRGRYSLRRQ